MFPTLITGDEALASFRESLVPDLAFDLLRDAGGRLLVALPVGVGKSQWLLCIARHAAQGDEYDLVVVLVPRWDILDEHAAGLADCQPHIVRPRPRKRCGPLDAEWQQHEAAGCTLLGRATLCAGCPRLRGCHWANSEGRRLASHRLILATQQNLVVNPQFLQHLKAQAQARRMLVLIDESDMLLKPARTKITRTELERFAAVLEGLPTEQQRAAWQDQLSLLMAAPTADLRDGNWRAPSAPAPWSLEVQRLGWERHGPEFRCLVHDIQQFARSDRQSRERLPDGSLQFSTPLPLRDDFIVFSGSIAPDVARYRLDPDSRRGPLVSPFQDHQFRHPQTRWFNISSPEGSARYFGEHQSRILDFFAEKVAENVRAGRRTLLVVREKFSNPSRKYLATRLKALGLSQCRVVTGHWNRHDLTNPATIPLVTYGVRGINRFEDFDAVYCLSGFYVDPCAVTEATYDLEPTEHRHPIRIEFDERQQRRVARVDMPSGEESILPCLAQGILDQLETDVVIQAVGRVRPFTRAREVVTFQIGVLPGAPVTLSFRSLAQARRFFGIATRRASEHEDRRRIARDLRATGMEIPEIAAKLGVSDGSVRRYLRARRGHEG